MNYQLSADYIESRIAVLRARDLLIEEFHAMQTPLAEILRGLLDQRVILLRTLTEIVGRLDSAAAETDCFNIYEARDLAKEALAALKQ